VVRPTVEDGLSEWDIIVNVKWTIFQLYHGENKLHSLKWW